MALSFDVMDEHEQGEMVQQWLRENAMSIVVGIALGVTLLFAYQQWRAHRSSHQLDAATQFEVFATDLDKKDVDSAKKLAAKLQSDYADTPYATLSAMRLADHYTQRDDNNSARAALQVAHADAGIDALKSLSGLYLARIDVASKKPQDALNLIAKLPDNGYDALRDDVRGDALAALGRNAAARDAYSKALKQLDSSGTEQANRRFIEMKLNDLAAAEKKGS